MEVSELQEADELSTHIRDAIKLTLDDLAAVEVEERDRSSVLRVVLGLRLCGDRSLQSASHAAAPAIAPASPAAPIDNKDVLGRISTLMKLDRDVLELVYDVEDGQPTLVISARKLPERKAEATKVIAQLLSAARQAAGIEEWTSANTIRAVVSDYGRLDTNNFAAHIQGLDKVALTKGKSTSRELKVTKAGMEDIATLIVSLVGGSS